MLKRVVVIPLLLFVVILCSTVYADPWDLSPRQAFEILKNDTSSFIVDVRTEAEWRWVGMLNEKELQNTPILESYLFWPGMDKNPLFEEHVMSKLSSNPKFNKQKSRVIFMCCCGGRSKKSSTEMREKYDIHAYNMLYGFNGDMNEQNQRDSINGWKFDHLPWHN